VILRLTSSIALILATVGGCTPPEEEGVNGRGASSGSSNRSSQTPTASIQDYQINEVDDNSRSALVAIVFRPATAREASLKWRTEPVTATADVDYLSSAGTLTIPQGSAKAEITIPLLGDLTDEATETFKVILSDPTNVSIGDGEGIVTIKDNDPEPFVRFEKSKIITSENTGKAKVRVLLSQPSSLDVTIPFLNTGSADEGLDYTLDSGGQLTIPAGQTHADIGVLITQDAIPEGGESIVFSLDTPTFATIDQKKANVTVVIKGEVSLPDTGVTHFADNISTSLITEPADFPGQDASHGLDTLPTASDIDGRAGFSFVKLDYAGNPLPVTAKTWSCVRDMNTGLTWEVKQPPYIPALDTSFTLGPYPALADRNFTAWYDRVLEDAKKERINLKLIYADFRAAGHHYHAGNYLYTWYNSDKSTNGGSEGAYVQIKNFAYPIGGWSILKAKDDATSRRWTPGENSEVLANELNLFGHCGMKNWRLPTITELKSIADYDPVAAKQRGSVIPPEFFPNGLQGLYLSGTASSDGNAETLCLDSISGDVKLCNKQAQAHFARMVRDEETRK